MSLLSDAKTHLRDMSSVLEISLERLESATAQQRLLLASQMVGSCDSLITVLEFFVDIPAMSRFAKKGKRHLARLRNEAKKIRAHAYREICTFEETPVEEAPVEEEPDTTQEVPMEPPAESAEPTT